MRYLCMLALLFSLGCGAYVEQPRVDTTQLMMYTSPRILMTATTARMICRLPSDVGEGQFIYGITGIFESQGPIDRIELDRIFPVPCQGPIHLYCGYRENGKQVKVISQDVELVGDCNANTSY